MCMIADKVAETVRTNVGWEQEKAGETNGVVPQIVFNINFSLPGMQRQNADGKDDNTLLTQDNSTMLTQNSGAIGY